MFLVDAEVEAENYGKKREEEEGGRRQRGMSKSKNSALCPIYSDRNTIVAVHRVT